VAKETEKSRLLKTTRAVATNKRKKRGDKKDKGPNPDGIPGIKAPWLDTERLGGRSGTSKRLLDEKSIFDQEEALLHPSPVVPVGNLARIRFDVGRIEVISDPPPESKTSLEREPDKLVRQRRGRKSAVSKYYFEHEREMSQLPTPELVSQLTEVAREVRHGNSADDYEKAHSSAVRFVRTLRPTSKKRNK
jgi:hypothetical protein